MARTPYSRQFYDRHRAGAASSAEVVVDLLPALGLGPMRRVLDLGCGQGVWLEAFAGAGATELTGVDGPWNTAHHSTDSRIRFVPMELDRVTVEELVAATEPPFDLAVCVEVLEHLPPAAGDAAVAGLTACAPVVLFSAAIPGQGGSGHQNEQWPSYWAERFARHGFAAYDAIRPLVWSDTRVQPWYRQNIFLYARPGALTSSEPSGPEAIDLVHPEVFTEARTHPHPSDWIRAAPRVAAQLARSAVARLRRVQSRAR